MFYWFIPHIYIIFVHLNITTATKRRLQGFEPAARLGVRAGVLGVPSDAGPNAGLEPEVELHGMAIDWRIYFTRDITMVTITMAYCTVIPVSLCNGM